MATIRWTSKVEGVLTNITSAVLCDPTGVFGLRRVDSGVIVVPANTAMTNSSTGVYEYEFSAVAGVSYQGYIKWVYEGRTDYYEVSYTSSSAVETSLSILANKSKYVDWIKQEFQPRTLAIPDASIEQMVDNAIRYWNTHSAYKISQMVEYSTGQVRAQLSPAFKSIAVIHPSKNANFIWNEFPTWSLAGIAVLDNIRTDLILATEAFRTFNIYAGANFRWWFEENHDDPSEGGYLYCRNVPSGTTGLYVIGTRRILPDDDIDSQHINDWICYYTKALVKQAEGHALRAAGLVLPGDVDGQTLYQEGATEMKFLQEDLQKSARWVVFAKRQ